MKRDGPFARRNAHLFDAGTILCGIVSAALSEPVIEAPARR